MKHSKIKALLQAIGFIIVFVITFIILSQLKHFFPENIERYAHGIVGTISSFATILLFLKLEKRTLKDYKLVWEKNTLKKCIVGIVIGMFFGSAMIFTQVLLSGLEITSRNQSVAPFLLAMPAILILALMEELAFRSYAFIKLNKKFGLRITQIIIGTLFALYHVANGWPIGLAFFGPGIWSWAYGLSAAVSNGISMPTGLHFGVNAILALFIGKKNTESLFKIDFPSEVSKDVIIANQNYGLIIHISLLILCITGTEIYLRSKSLQQLSHS